MLRSAVSIALLSAAIAAVPARAHELTMSARVDDATDAGRFACGDTVYLHVAWRPPMPAPHALRAVWRNTATGVSDLTTAPDTPASWIWLRFEPGAGAGMARLYAPDAAYDEFAGLWVVHVTLDGKSLGEKRFEIQC